MWTGSGKAGRANGGVGERVLRIRERASWTRELRGVVGGAEGKGNVDRERQGAGGVDREWVVWNRERVMWIG